MARLKIKLTRNLRRSILRGQPWVYREGIALPPGARPERAQLCQVIDAKGELAWAIYDPHGPLALRILSIDKAPPNAAHFERQFARALALRASIRSPQTTAFRLFNGEGDFLPGLVCDVYGEIAVVQFDGQGPGEFWDKDLIGKWLMQQAGVRFVVEKTRRGSDQPLNALAGDTLSSAQASDVIVLENGARFHVNIEKGQKTGFFLDQRDNRDFVRSVSRDKSVLNMFSYTGGFSIYAGLGQASRVASLDVARAAIDLAESNWQLNGIAAGKHEGLCVDVFEYLQNAGEKWDHVLVDPPSMSHSESQRDVAKAKYIELFGASARLVRAEGALSLSSCSSHVSFEDFFEIIDEALSISRRRGRILRVSGQGLDHPFPHSSHELRYLKFVHLALD